MPPLSSEGMGLVMITRIKKREAVDKPVRDCDVK